MDKGKKIASLMACLLCISLLSFLMIINRGNNQGVVDFVRYVKGDTKDGITEYTFYFKDRDKMKAYLEYKSNDIWTIVFEDYEYSYTVEGISRKDSKVTAKENYEDLNTEPFDLFTQKLFRYMIFGKPPVITFWQAVTVFLTVLSGGAVIYKAEELWYIVGKRKPEEIAKWEELGIYKKVGASIIALGALLLLFFIFV